MFPHELCYDGVFGGVEKRTSRVIIQDGSIRFYDSSDGASVCETLLYEAAATTIRGKNRIKAWVFTLAHYESVFR